MKKILLKEHLLFKDHYQWHDFPDDDPRISGALTDTPFNTEEGNEVLYLTNTLLNIWKFDEERYARKIEKMIRCGLPRDIGSQKAAKAWIKEHWLNY